MASYTSDLTSTSYAYPSGVENAFDDNTETGAQGSLSPPNAAIGQNFGVTNKKNIRKLRVYRGSFGGSGGINGKFQYSDDGASWSDTNITSIILTDNTNYWQDFDVNDYGKRQYWRVCNPSESYIHIQEIEMMELMPWSKFSKRNGSAISTVNKINGIAKTTFGKVNGISVNA